MSVADIIRADRIESTRTIALAGIEYKSCWLRDDAVELTRHVHMLVSLPDFETRAEDAIKGAEMALTEALLAVKLAKSELKKKRITGAP